MSQITRSSVRSEHGVFFELCVAVVVLGGLSLWLRLTGTLLDPLNAFFGPGVAAGFAPAAWVVKSGIFAAGICVFGYVYAIRRGFDVGARLPRTTDWRVVGLALFVPFALVGLTALVADATGVPYHELTNSYYRPEAGLRPVLGLVGLSLLVTLPSVLLAAQVVIQRGLAAALDRDTAVVLTTLFGGLLFTGHSGLTIGPTATEFFGATLFVAAVALALYANANVSRRGLRRAAYLPVIALPLLVLAGAVVDIDSLAGGLFSATLVCVVGLAAYGYDRTDSLLVPALAYLAVLLANDLVVLLQAGF